MVEGEAREKDVEKNLYSWARIGNESFINATVWMNLKSFILSGHQSKVLVRGKK